jgi:hypothetical protein
MTSLISTFATVLSLSISAALLPLPLQMAPTTTGSIADGPPGDQPMVHACAIPTTDEPPIHQSLLVDDFESYPVGEPPGQWEFITSGREIMEISEALESGEEFRVMKEGDNQFLRSKTNAEALRFSVRNGEQIDWNINETPRIAWRWRAIKLPEGASEKGKNDTGGAVYVTFGSDWLGRPKSIKYTYSSSLPVGTVVEFGPLKVIVIDSAREPRTGQWKDVVRNVKADYRQVFGGKPPNRPVSITLWNDSDTTGDSAIVDFDDIRLLPPYQRDN